jgi:hypothetical protein
VVGVTNPTGAGSSIERGIMNKAYRIEKKNNGVIGIID